MKFEKGKGSDFYNNLNLEIDRYFKSNNLTKYATPAIYIKGGILLFMYMACYASTYFLPDNLLLLVPIYMIMGLSGVMIVFNLVHDASHGAISRNKTLNNAIKYIGDLVGINTYIWDIRHNIQHHTFTNVLGGDLIIENIPLLRMSPHQPWRRHHAFQVYYSIFLYMFYSFYWMFVIDFRLFFMKEICNLKNLKHPKKEWILLVFFKLVYVTYSIVLPILLTPLTALQVIGLFLVMHAAAGLLLSFIAVLGHFVEGPSFPEAENGIIPKSWSEHELEATIDFAPSSKVINWITGGLNTHVAHHLYPQVCHTHYYAMTPIIEKFCMDNGYPYKKETFSSAIASHFRYLKKLSKKEEQAAGLWFSLARKRVARKTAKRMLTPRTQQANS
jgi:linoleoyl-CoA desaturase